MPQRQGSCITPLRQSYMKHTHIHTGNRQRCIMAALLSKYASACGCVLPGISLTVVLPGYDVLEQLSSCHPVERQRENSALAPALLSVSTTGTQSLIDFFNCLIY